MSDRPLDLSQLVRQRQVSLEEFEVQMRLRCPGCRRRLSKRTGVVDWVIVAISPVPGPAQGVFVPAVSEVRTCRDELCVAWQECRRAAWVCTEPPTPVWLEAAPEPDSSQAGGGRLMDHLAPDGRLPSTE